MEAQLRKQVIWLQHGTRFLDDKFDNKHSFQMTIVDTWNNLLKGCIVISPHLDKSSQIVTLEILKAQSNFDSFKCSHDDLVLCITPLV